MQSESEQVVIVGVGQVVQRDADLKEAREPIALMEEAARRAADDAGPGAALLGAVDQVVAVNVLGWRYPSAATLLAQRLGRDDARPMDTTGGGNTPQSAVNELARRLRAGSIRCAVVAGSEAIRSRRRAKAEGVPLDWTRQGPEPGAGHEMFGSDRNGVSELEHRHGLFLPIQFYPMFENALRGRLGVDLGTHRESLGRLYERFSQVAAENPHAWFPKARTAEEIATPTETNRIIGFPYTKYMNAVMEVDQGAAVVVTTAATARELGVPEDRLVHLWGGGDGVEDPWFVSERPRLDACPAQRIAIEAALAEAGIEADALAACDLYSCFPVAVELACEALGIEADDPRPLTLTGGLAYAGGPGNAYSLHGIAQLVEFLRREGGCGLVTALGWYLTKHGAGVYGRGPRPGPSRDARSIDRGEPVTLAETPTGPGTVEAYTIVHDREGPAQGIVLGRDEQGRRFVANTPEDRGLLAELETRELVGTRGQLSMQGESTRFDPR